MIDKLEQTELWSKFKHWFDKQNYEIPLFTYTEYADNNCEYLGFYDMPFNFQSGVFLKFLEEYFECIMERMYGEGFGICYSLIDNTNYKPISFRGFSGFYTLEELILAAFENE